MREFQGVSIDQQLKIHSDGLAGILVLRNLGYENPGLDRLERWHDESIDRLVSGYSSFMYDEWLRRDKRLREASESFLDTK